MKMKEELSYEQFLIMRFIFNILYFLEEKKSGLTVKDIVEVLKSLLEDQPKEYGEIFMISKEDL